MSCGDDRLLKAYPSLVGLEPTAPDGIGFGLVVIVGCVWLADGRPDDHELGCVLCRPITAIRSWPAGTDHNHREATSVSIDRCFAGDLVVESMNLKWTVAEAYGVEICGPVLSCRGVETPILSASRRTLTRLR